MSNLSSFTIHTDDPKVSYQSSEVRIRSRVTFPILTDLPSEGTETPFYVMVPSGLILHDRIETLIVNDLASVIKIFKSVLLYYQSLVKEKTCSGK